MDEPAIILKTAELALSKSWVELFDDALKIGIPSIVACAGIISTYFLTKSGHEKNLELERLRVSHDIKKEVHARTSELVKGISLGLAEQYQSMLAYSDLLSAKLSMENDGLLFPKDSRKELSAHYQSYVDTLQESFLIESQVLLLDQEDISEAFENYQIVVLEFSTSFVPSVSQEKFENLHCKRREIRGYRKTLFGLLGKLYLISQKG